MKQMRKITLIVVAILAYHNTVTAQVETKVTQGFTINGTGWNKYLHSGEPVTIISYKEKEGIHSLGIYSDDYAGVIDMKIIPFDVQPKQLKKLPSNAKKKLVPYYEKARSRAREKALAGKYKTIANDMILSREMYVSVSKGDPITIIGYKEQRNYMGGYHVSNNYYYSIVKKDAAGICESYELDKITINGVPLPFLPSTDDPQVKSFIAREKNEITNRRNAEYRAREKAQREAWEDERRRAAAQKAHDDSIKAINDSLEIVEAKQSWENLKKLTPAMIDVGGWSMDGAGGICVNISFTNCSFQRVKYVYFRGYFLNAVGDRCRNEITGSTEWKYRGVGPIDAFPKTQEENHYTHISFWSFNNPLFYASTANAFRLSSVTIEYMNGKKITLTGAELKKRVKYPY